MPRKTPDEIMGEHLTMVDQEALFKYLIGYQKMDADWDNYRKKIPDDLLEKFARVLEDCRNQGFINPHIVSNKLVWRQIRAFRRNHDMTDSCSLCAASFRAGQCRGRGKIKPVGFLFVPCWAE